MGIVIPSEKISGRWNGALQTRLRRAPLEQFLSVRQLTLARAGSAQVCDNLCRATIWLVEAITADRAVENQEEPNVGSLACAVCHGLAASIDEVCHWRVAALVSGCQLLTPRWGAMSAARLAAKAVQAYHDHYFLDGAEGELDVIRAAARSTLLGQTTGDRAGAPGARNHTNAFLYTARHLQK